MSWREPRLVHCQGMEVVTKHQKDVPKRCDAFPCRRHAPLRKELQVRRTIFCG